MSITALQHERNYSMKLTAMVKVISHARPYARGGAQDEARRPCATQLDTDGEVK